MHADTHGKEGLPCESSRDKKELIMCFLIVSFQFCFPAVLHPRRTHVLYVHAMLFTKKPREFTLLLKVFQKIYNKTGSLRQTRI
jgi:hypothetical protein